MKVLIAGSTGMIGTAFVKHLKAQGHEVFGLARVGASARHSISASDHFYTCDILEKQVLQKIFREVSPDLAINLAAQAFNGVSWEAPHTTMSTNVVGTMNFLECCREFCPNAKVLIACSSAEYGVVPLTESPVKEERLLTPVSPYGVSKVATECLGYQYFANYGLQVYLPRLFIHVGPGHPPATAIQNFARQLAMIGRGLRTPEIRVGRLDTARDFVDVRDGVRAMMHLVDKGNAGEPYNICTGRAYTMAWVLETLIGISGLHVRVSQDPALLRPSDELLLVGDPTKIQNLGWCQDYSLEQTLAEIYADWMSRVA